MFRRTETARERVLLRLIERQERTIRDLTDRLMYVNGNAWTPPPQADDPDPAEWAPEAWSASPEQEPVY